MKIQFICSGNTYRSRLAEAYLNSLQIKGISAISSGAHAKTQPMEIRWYTERLLEEHGLSRFASPTHRQTTTAGINACGLVVFLGPSVYKCCKKNYTIKKPHIIWDVKDVNCHDSDAKLLKLTEKSFKEIKNKVKELLATFINKKSPSL